MQLHSRIALTSVLLTFAMAIPASAQHARERGRGHGPSGGGVVRAVPRSAPAVGSTWVARPRVVRPYAFRPPVYRSYGYRPFGYRPFARPYFRPFSRPYYAFRPHLSIGFGLFAGYPVPYPYAYAYPVPAPYPVDPGYSNPYPPPSGSSGYSTDPYSGQSTSVAVDPNDGGLSFEISPASAAVLVDGNYVGTAGEFTPTSGPLTLSAGQHRVEIQLQGYQPMVFDADVQPGQVSPYRGTMIPY